MEVKQTLGTLTTALVTLTTKVEELPQGKASQVDPMSAQPGTRAGGTPPATSLQVAIMSAQPGTRAEGISNPAANASIDLDTEQHIRNMVEHHVSTAHVPALAYTDDETEGEEEARP